MFFIKKQQTTYSNNSSHNHIEVTAQTIMCNISKCKKIESIKKRKQNQMNPKRNKNLSHSKRSKMFIDTNLKIDTNLRVKYLN